MTSMGATAPGPDASGTDANGPPSQRQHAGLEASRHSLGHGDYVFGEADGGPLRYEAFYRKHYRPAVAAVGRADATFRALRHTYASLMAPHMDMLELSRRMGHQSYALTADVYSHLYERDDLAKAAALDAAYTATGTTNVVPLRGR